MRRIALLRRICIRTFTLRLANIHFLPRSTALQQQKRIDRDAVAIDPLSLQLTSPQSSRQLLRATRPSLQCLARRREVGNARGISVETFMEHILHDLVARSPRGAGHRIDDLLNLVIERTCALFGYARLFSARKAPPSRSTHEAPVAASSPSTSDADQVALVTASQPSTPRAVPTSRMIAPSLASTKPHPRRSPRFSKRPPAPRAAIAGCRPHVATHLDVTDEPDVATRPRRSPHLLRLARRRVLRHALFQFDQ